MYNMKSVFSRIVLVVILCTASMTIVYMVSFMNGADRGEAAFITNRDC